jgi:hypothetical protein
VKDIDRLTAALVKISAIRDSIIGLQNINWSEHIYPLVAALDEAGFEGAPYPEAREYVGTLLERNKALEDHLRKLIDAVRREPARTPQLENALRFYDASKETP